MDEETEDPSYSSTSGESDAGEESDRTEDTFDGEKWRAALRIQRAWRAWRVFGDLKAGVLRLVWGRISENEESMGMMEFEQSLNLRRNLRLKVSSKLWTSSERVDMLYSYSLDRASNKFELEQFPEPITAEFCDLLIGKFRKGLILGNASAHRLLEMTAAMLRERHRNALAEIEVPEDAACVTIVGDLHGQLKDLLVILEKNGRPRPGHLYLFNGDLVDRGAYGVEVCFVVFAFALALPRHVWINRGNHEALSMNLKYAFDLEVLSKYDNATFLLFQDVFCALPLASVIARQIFVAHGGLPPGPTSLADIAAVPLGAQPPSGYPEEASGVIFKALLWNDPRDHIQGTAPSARGRGVLMFGSDLSQRFLEDNALRLIVRSHEQVEDGYQSHHGHRVITVFSASDYCAVNRNYGSVMNFPDPADLSRFEFFRYHALPLQPDVLPPAQDTRSVRLAELQRQVGTFLADKIFINLHELRAQFEACDQLFSHRISFLQWKQAMTKALQLDLPWLSLRGLIVPASAYEDPSLHNPEALMIFPNFLNGFQFSSSVAIVDKWELVVLDDFFQRLLSCPAADPEQVQLGLESVRCSEGTLEFSPDRLAAFAAGWGIPIEPDKASMICRSLESRFMSTSSPDFLAYLYRHQRRLKHHKAHEEFWTKSELAHIGAALRQQHHSLRTAFKALDTKQKGYLRLKRVRKIIGALPLPNKLDKGQCIALAQYIDADGSGRLTYEEFENCFSSIADLKHHYRWMRQALEELARLIISNKSSLRRAFIEFDRDQSGSIDLSEFIFALECFNHQLSTPLTSDQIVQLFHTLDADGSDSIEWQEFLNSFTVMPIPVTPKTPMATMSSKKPPRSPHRQQRHHSNSSSHSSSHSSSTSSSPVSKLTFSSASHLLTPLCKSSSSKSSSSSSKSASHPSSHLSHSCFHPPHSQHGPSCGLPEPDHRSKKHNKSSKDKLKPKGKVSSKSGSKHR